ncbi:MAG: hypothetical protein A3H57_03985 [Candidatus Taylorbacteria bacterium RIFCSPLOWO2_02_FULL_43_11]|uniref:Glycosyltransferase subfamily 4-like N-terminal domain-containing protein n=1 Tax=Candidatus Taylorbacteria bacterium RIFCSPHIGHO2_02_FULL_43_32b TaxID=1802306 RepID=A0A1G2MJ86_9BACT|nr:MAG: hypothetical protein A2743_01710 [Candidatus Taylorbacteria bacterium RIFCSPHIGHO2_01_FULL_43_47]OHA23936.1 MAG: hypothetical protein A3C72_00540 [Candidatus Taylorbacteria bacterium RIFCSPHIGHO2_02_FULL_43_32b]OHA31000.1 MAG: hypothetical protein A3B08_04385 [Candidatus Taylorbacteria bacterium RIFCSPLOWO2_01_FULL_43_44]OHA37208.1 MAG: hypothetical protein A3H57_03985 [Candidatus Taylorbacteria bacterium RIFCSPLOWO2_02_FULL_43_11]
MKFAYIANVRMPTEKAHGLQIMEMCSAFAKEGAEVTLFVPWRFNKIKIDAFSYYGIGRVFKIKKIPAIDIMPIWGGRAGFFLLQVSFYIFAKIFLLFSAFDVVYCREPITPLFFRNSIFEVHNMPVKVGWVFKLALKRVRHFFPVTGFLKEALISAGAPQGKITVAPDGVNLESFKNLPTKDEARRRLQLPIGKKLVLYTGSFYLYSWKGVDVLLDAARDFGEDTIFVLVGGDEKEIAEIKKGGVSDNVILISHRPHSEMPIYMKAADVLVLPNKTGSLHSEKYTSPLKLFEYMASGTPIVASKLPSICEVLNEKNAVLVEPDMKAALAISIKKVLQNSAFSLGLAEMSRRDVAKYSWQERARVILRIVSGA